MNAYELLYGPYLYDYRLYYTHQCVITDILTAISVNIWQHQCMYVSMYYIQNFLFISYFLLLKLFLLYF